MSSYTPMEFSYSYIALSPTLEIAAELAIYAMLVAFYNAQHKDATGDNYSALRAQLSHPADPSPHVVV